MSSSMVRSPWNTVGSIQAHPSIPELSRRSSPDRISPKPWATSHPAGGPSDAIALALRTGTPIHAAETVLTEAGIAVPDEQEDEVERFREFLYQISPDDFVGGTSGPDET